MKDKGTKELVVIGNGMAGVAAVEEILRYDPGRYNITIFGKEARPNYNRVLLTEVLTGKKSLEDITLNDFNWYKRNNITLRSGSRVVRIDRRRRVVATEDGTTVQYNRLVLATGSVPLVPDIPGTDKQGVYSFRDMNDCEGIKEAAGSGKRALVVGGGILGLEVAYGLHELGMEVTVLHITKRLMESHLDDISAMYLKEDLERLGITVMLNSEAGEILGGERVSGVRLEDGGSVDADIVVFSTGIRPNISLAAEAGLYCERGIVVGDTMQTYDPSIYAVGECIQHRGATFGLVAQVFDHARVLANQLAGDGRLYFKKRPVSMKLKVPGIELYVAGDVREGPGVETIEYTDRGGKIYKRVFIVNQRIRGLILYGDTSEGPELFEHILSEDDLSEKRRYIFGTPSSGRPSRAVDDMPADAIVCGCNGVTKAMIVEAVKTKGLFTLEDVRRETKASASCGGCTAMVEQILESVLGSDFRSASAKRSICQCTKYTRDDIIKNIREKRLRSVQEVMETLGWETVGCERCRPAINYYVSMVWPRDSVDDPTSRLVNERMHANIQKDGTFSVVPRMYAGATTPAELKRIAEAAEKHNVPLVKITGGQRIALIGVDRTELPSLWRELDMPSGYAYAKALRTVKSCVGSKFCRYGTQDSLGLAARLEKRYEGLWMPAKVKIGVSGCPRNCAEAAVKDVGIVGVTGGFEVYVGGCGGIELRGAKLLCTLKTEDEVIDVVGAFIQHYREEAHYGERTFKWVERMGLENIKGAVVKDLNNRKRLLMRIEEALGVVRDPWRERLEGAGAA